MPDTLLVMPTVGANWPMAEAALATAMRSAQVQMDYLIVLDEPPIGPQPSEFCQRKGVFLVTNPTRVGLVAAVNEGFRWFLSREDWHFLVILEDGITVAPGWDDRLRRTLIAHPQFGWVACGQIENALAPFTSFCSMMTKSCAERVGGLDPMFTPCQFDDGDLFMRCVAHGFKPHGVEWKVSHPRSRTSRDWSEADDIALMRKHQELFRMRWGMSDMPWSLVPIHAVCEVCR